MKPAHIRIIERLLGIPLCFFFTLLRKLGERFFSPQGKVDAVQRILFLKLIEQGATVLAYPAIQRAAQRVGRENLYFLVFEENREILEIMELLPKENILSIRNRSFIVFLVDTLKVLFRLRCLAIDCVVDMEFFSRASALIAYLSGARIRIGLHRFMSEFPYRGDLMTHRIQYNYYLHTADTYLLLVESIGLSPDEVPQPKISLPATKIQGPSFVPKEEEIVYIRELFSLAHMEVNRERPIIILNPNAGDMLPLRKWPEENFLLLGRRLLEDYPDLYLLLTGSPAERDAVERLCRAFSSRRVASFAGKTSIRELLTLYTIGDVLVTNDSGPAHFATLTPIHGIVLYGPETPHLFGARGENIHVLYAKLACSPCVNVFNHRFSPCRDNRCLKAITVEMVYEKVRECLKARGK